MLTIKRLSECTFEEATKAWNRGFEGYYFDAAATVERFTHRLGMEGLSPALSVVGFIDGEPVGLVLSGVRTIDGKKVAWNGGTGVATEYRRQGVGRKLMEAALSLYREEGIDLATLEAFTQNEKAIALYQQLGYEIVDRLLFLQYGEASEVNPFTADRELPYRHHRGIPQDVRGLSYYHSMAPWQTQWAGIRDGEAVLVQDEQGETVGYALSKRTFDESGKLTSIVLFQCAAHPEREDGEAIVRYALSQVFAPFDLACRRTTFNFPAANEQVVSILQQAGFQPSTEQVNMIRKMEK
jgi:ribosomal protein S18 acetylase RimI-like enzyme